MTSRIKKLVDKEVETKGVDAVLGKVVRMNQMNENLLSFDLDNREKILKHIEANKEIIEYLTNGKKD